jgi:two-component system, OmpR family, phosphate regulon sensor histidine kinase PhoR
MVNAAANRQFRVLLQLFLCDMKYKRFRWLISGMALALAGIICIQVYWLDKAVRAERKKFLDEVREAMAQATIRLERGEAFTMLSNALIPSDSVDSILTGRKRMRIIHNERIVSPPTPLPQHPGTQPIPPVPGTQPTHAVPGTSPGHPVPPHPPRPGIPPAPPIPGVEVPPVPPTPPVMMEFDSILETDSTSQVVILQRSDRFRSAVKDVWMEYVMKNANVHQRISQKEIEKSLKESFARNGIEESFDYGVYDRHASVFRMISDSAKKNQLLHAGLRVPLFPGDFHAGREELVVRVNAGNERIFLSLWPQLAVAILLTLVLILVSWLTFREALLQKKISEIRNDFINNMTHEFKTPIATISLAADTVMNPQVIRDPEKVQHYAEIIKLENKRMNEQVEKVLELALAERRELELEKAPVDLCLLVKHAIQSIALQVTARGGTIATSGDCSSFSIEGDAFHLERAFLNLLDNAVKYSTCAPEIRVIAEVSGNAFSLQIADRGIGIKSEDQSRVFDRFFRVSTGNRHDVKGFGLGLSYVKTIVELHGGKISVMSKPGEGSTFKIVFAL